MPQLTVQQALQLASGHAHARRFQVAESICRQILSARPEEPEAWHLLGLVAAQCGRFNDAIHFFRQAVALVPANPDYHANLGAALHDGGELDHAIVSYRQAISLNSSLAQARSNLGQLLLFKGCFKEGWEQYEWRWKCKNFPPSRHRSLSPFGAGENIAGKTVLLHTEQGFGDAIQFARYVPLVARRAAAVIVECQPLLRSLFESLEGVRTLHEHNDPLPPFDLHAPFLSLPGIFNTTLSTLPADTPYLKAEPKKIAHWKHFLDQHLPPDPPALKIGLVWAGNSSQLANARRSIPLSALAPFHAMPGIHFISLQKGPPADDLLSAPFPLLDAGRHLQDFSDTAALLHSLDLLITVDTAVAHLAGALALPVWTLLSSLPDWRWLEHRADSPWYPTMRLFRQTNPGDWAPVIESLVQALTQKSRHP